MLLTGGHKSRVPANLSLALIHLLEQLTQLRKPIYSLDPGWITKGYTSGIFRWKRFKEQDMGKGYGDSMLSQGVPITLNLHMFTNLEAVSALSLRGFTKSSLIKSLTIGN